MTTKLQPEIAKEGLLVPSPESLNPCLSVPGPESLSPCLSSPALENPSIARCIRVWEKARRAKLEDGGTPTDAKEKAGEAYSATLPPLTTRENCRDFIACVAQGVLLGAIPANNAGKLLYAAQVALLANTIEEKSQRYAGYEAYADLTESEAAHVKKFLPQRSKN